MRVLEHAVRSRRRGGALASTLFAMACGPQISVPSEGSASSSASTSTVSSSADETQTASVTGSTSTMTGVDSGGSGPAQSEGSTSVGNEQDEARCLQLCLNANALGCTPPWSGEECYTRCLDELMWAEEQGCLSEQRDIQACEGQASDLSEVACETFECEDEYKRHDLCGGSCSHLGGVPGGGSSQTECRWRGTCYGHDFEVLCPTEGTGGQCQCLVDERVMAQCDHGEPLTAFECDPTIHVFTTCCQATFEGVLFP